jgi:hypothetical protein
MAVLSEHQLDGPVGSRSQRRTGHVRPAVGEERDSRRTDGRTCCLVARGAHDTGASRRHPCCRAAPPR